MTLIKNNDLLLFLDKNNKLKFGGKEKSLNRTNL